MFSSPAGFSLSATPYQVTNRPFNPTHTQGVCPFGVVWFGLLPVRSPLLRESFLVLALLRCFSSGGSLHAPMDSVRGRTPYRVRGCPIRRSSAHRVLSPPRRLSQLPTSFIGTQRLGIHRMPL